MRVLILVVLCFRSTASRIGATSPNDGMRTIGRWRASGHVPDTFLVALLVLAALGMFATGCGPVGDPSPLPGQAEAVRLIYEVYGERHAPPAIYWRRDTCDAPNGIYGRWPACSFDLNGERVSGAHYDLDGRTWIEVGAPSTPSDRISQTALAHELLHAHQWNEGIDDPGHTTPEWGCLSGHNTVCITLVGVAIDRLAAAGY
jgi:hypothetical protein